MSLNSKKKNIETLKQINLHQENQIAFEGQQYFLSVLNLARLKKHYQIFQKILQKRKIK